MFACRAEGNEKDPSVFCHARSLKERERTKGAHLIHEFLGISLVGGAAAYLHVYNYM